MGFEIPEPYIWDESFRTFYDTVDDEHKLLFQGVFGVAENPGSQGAVDYMYTVMSYHFADEEGMMQRANYDGYDTHKICHDEFLAKIKVSAPVDSDFLVYAKNWLVNHIKTIDFKDKGQL
uniref:Hemerythrin n=1 Tax=Phascolosoma agassizii TaxID=360543 RepID=A0A1S6QCU5_9ANNE|nr:hemerythrin [Phascolosoma agassizii]